MAVYYSFHYKRDAFRVQKVIQMGALEGQQILKPQEWEAVKARGDKAIESWIDDKMRNKTALVVLIGTETSQRRWVRHEIIKAWNENRRMVGIHIHRLLGSTQQMDPKGANPFAKISLTNGRTMDAYVPVYDPLGADSQAVYNTIKANLKSWVDGGYKPS